MFKTVLALTAIVLLFSAGQLQAAVIDSNWVGGGDDHSWDDANNWDPNVVPDNSDTNTFAVTIDARSFPNEVHIRLQQNRTIDRLDSDGEVKLDSWMQWWPRLKLEDDANGLTNRGEIEIERIAIYGNVRNNTPDELNLEDMDLYGNLYNQSGASIEIDREVGINGSLENDGDIGIFFAADLRADQLDNVNVIDVQGGICGPEDGTFHNDSNGIIRGFGEVCTDALFQNKGEICATNGVLILTYGTITNSGLLVNKPLSSLHIRRSLDAQGQIEDANNQGTIEVNAGGVAFDCNLVNMPDANIILLGGTLAATTITQKPDANFRGFGGIAGDVLIESGAQIKITGPTHIIGDVNIAAGASLEINDGQTLITGHTVCDGTIHLIGGTVIFQGGCDCDGCTIINEAGSDRNHFDINADGIENLKDFAEFADDWLWQASWY